MFAAFPMEFDYAIAVLVAALGFSFLAYDVYQTHRRRKK